MIEAIPRLTPAGIFDIEGPGLHSGEPVRAVIKPGNQGIRFWSGVTGYEAIPANVTDTNRCTVLGDIATIEHLMSAFAGLGITDAEVEVTGREMPAAGGCASPYVDELLAIGTVQVGEIAVDGPFARVYHVDQSIKIAIAHGEGHWRYDYILDDRWPGTQSAEINLRTESYGGMIAPARTFALEEELPMVKAAGLAKGLDETSALILGAEGYVNKERFGNEPARHKLLDLIGDLALSGIPAQFLNVVGERSGHRTNVEAAAKLLQHVTIIRS